MKIFLFLTHQDLNKIINPLNIFQLKSIIRNKTDNLQNLMLEIRILISRTSRLEHFKYLLNKLSSMLNLIQIFIFNSLPIRILS
jgi:hypothetical protein